MLSKVRSLSHLSSWRKISQEGPKAAIKDVLLSCWILNFKWCSVKRRVSHFFYPWNFKIAYKIQTTRRKTGQKPLAEIENAIDDIKASRGDKTEIAAGLYCVKFINAALYGWMILYHLTLHDMVANPAFALFNVLKMTMDAWGRVFLWLFQSRLAII